MKFNRNSALYRRAKASIKNHGLTPSCREKAILYRMIRMSGGEVIKRRIVRKPPKLDQPIKPFEDLI